MNIFLPGTILKPSMVISGDKNSSRADFHKVATMTIDCLKSVCPKDLGGVAFLSGGQSDEEATQHLSLMNKEYTDLPWRVTFSYARAIQQSALNTWRGDAWTGCQTISTILLRYQIAFLASSIVLPLLNNLDPVYFSTLP